MGALVHAPLCLHATVVVPQLFKLYSHLHAGTPAMGNHTHASRSVSHHSDCIFDGCLLTCESFSGAQRLRFKRWKIRTNVLAGQFASGDGEQCSDSEFTRKCEC